MKKQTKTIVTLVDLSNKSRQGTYIRISRSDKPTRYYKYTGSQGQLDATVSYYDDSVTKKTKGSYKKYTKAYEEKSVGTKPTQRTSVTRKAEQYIAQAKKRGSLNTQFKQGVAQIVIPQLKGISVSELHDHKALLLSQLVLDKDLIKILANSENFNKILNRIDYQITLQDSGKDIVSAFVHGRSPELVQQEVERSLLNNEEVSEQKYRCLDVLKQLGYQAEKLGNGTITTIKVVMTFRKG